MLPIWGQRLNNQSIFARLAYWFHLKGLPVAYKWIVEFPVIIRKIFSNAFICSGLGSVISTTLIEFLNLDLILVPLEKLLWEYWNNTRIKYVFFSFFFELTSTCRRKFNKTTLSLEGKKTRDLSMHWSKLSFLCQNKHVFLSIDGFLLFKEFWLEIIKPSI